MTEIDKADLQSLLKQTAFLRWLYRQTERAGIFTIATSGADHANLSFAEGRRSIVLEALQECEQAQPIGGVGIPALTLIQMLRETAQSAAKEKPLGRRRDPYGELSDDGDSTGE
jgi:hypothetical protein